MGLSHVLLEQDAKTSTGLSGSEQRKVAGNKGCVIRRHTKFDCRLAGSRCDILKNALLGSAIWGPELNITCAKRM